MKEQLKHRLQELKAEFDLGQKALAESEAKSKELRDTLLRISGAIQVLEEELGKQDGGRELAGVGHAGAHVPPNGGTHS